MRPSRVTSQSPTSSAGFWCGDFVGWLVDRWLHTGGIATAIGAVLGAAGGVYLIVRRLGA